MEQNYKMIGSCHAKATDALAGVQQHVFTGAALSSDCAVRAPSSTRGCPPCAALHSTHLQVVAAHTAATPCGPHSTSHSVRASHSCPAEQQRAHWQD